MIVDGITGALISPSKSSNTGIRSTASMTGNLSRANTRAGFELNEYYSSVKADLTSYKSLIKSISQERETMQQRISEMNYERSAIQKNLNAVTNLHNSVYSYLDAFQAEQTLKNSFQAMLVNPKLVQDSELQKSSSKSMGKAILEELEQATKKPTDDLLKYKGLLADMLKPSAFTSCKYESKKLNDVARQDRSSINQLKTTDKAPWSDYLKERYSYDTAHAMAQSYKSENIEKLTGNQIAKMEKGRSLANLGYQSMFTDVLELGGLAEQELNPFISNQLLRDDVTAKQKLSKPKFASQNLGGAAELGIVSLGRDPGMATWLGGGLSPVTKPYVTAPQLQRFFSIYHVMIAIVETIKQEIQKVEDVFGLGALGAPASIQKKVNKYNRIVKDTEQFLNAVMQLPVNVMAETTPRAALIFGFLTKSRRKMRKVINSLDRFWANID